MKNQKSLTNKGFSLVELIIVVAIMAVLIGVLAPQYLRYVERTRLQRDNTSMGELANVIKMASAEEKVIQELSTAVTITFDGNGNLETGSIGTELGKEITATMAYTDVKLTSNTYLKSGAQPQITVKINPSNNQIEVTATGWVDKPTDTPTTAANPKKF